MLLCLVCVYLSVLKVAVSEQIISDELPSKESSSIEYLTMTQEINIPVVVNVDKVLRDSLIKEKQMKKFRAAIKRIFYEVETIFPHRNLNQRIKLNIIDVNYLRNRSNSISMDENSSNYLKSYCQVQSDKKRLKKKWYYSILISGLDFYYLNSAGQKTRSSSGRGYMSGICTVDRSCTLVKWRPKNMAYVLAHEIGHSLGIYHDGFPNKCKASGFIMGSQYDPKNQHQAWSTCSRRYLRRFLKSKKSWCLRLNNG